jgi:hypothetical protein
MLCGSLLSLAILWCVWLLDNWNRLKNRFITVRPFIFSAITVYLLLKVVWHAMVLSFCTLGTLLREIGAWINRSRESAKKEISSQFSLPCKLWLIDRVTGLCCFWFWHSLSAYCCRVSGLCTPWDCSNGRQLYFPHSLLSTETKVTCRCFVICSSWTSSLNKNFSFVAQHNS